MSFAIYEEIRITLVLNSLLFYLLQALLVLTGFLMGLAANNNHLTLQWIVYYIYAALHVVLFLSVSFLRSGLPRSTAIVIILAWIITGYLIF